jgi:hypothetical protein
VFAIIGLIILMMVMIDGTALYFHNNSTGVRNIVSLKTAIIIALASLIIWSVLSFITAFRKNDFRIILMILFSSYFFASFLAGRCLMDNEQGGGRSSAYFLLGSVFVSIIMLFFLHNTCTKMYRMIEEQEREAGQKAEGEGRIT